mmetsp:Transcript_28377/g.85558  ORF Transcript_28377/g.85558 Transcript_28377/m.85558 type:complete len:249 (+) Transcript_28377:271-1017(+)
MLHDWLANGTRLQKQEFSFTVARSNPRGHICSELHLALAPQRPAVHGRGLGARPEEVYGPVGARRARRHLPRGARVQAARPDRQATLGLRRPARRRGRRRCQSLERASDERDIHLAPLAVLAANARQLLAPQHFEARCGHLPRAGEVQPNLKQFHSVFSLGVYEWKHLGVRDAPARRHPLHVATPEAARATERVGVIDAPVPHHRDGLEASVRVLREARHGLAVVHVPVRVPEIRTDVPAAQQRPVRA